MRAFNGPLSGTTRVSQYQKGKTSVDFTEARDSEWQWHQLGRTQVCTSLQTDNHASTPPLKFFTGRMPFLPPNQQRQSTEGINLAINKNYSNAVERQSTYDQQSQRNDWRACNAYRNRSCPAVSHICSFTDLPPTLTILLPNSTPIVWLESCRTAHTVS